MADLRTAELRLQDAALALVEDTIEQAAEALHEVDKIYQAVGHSDNYFLQDRERCVRLAEELAGVVYLENADGSRHSTMREKLLKAESRLANPKTVH